MSELTGSRAALFEADPKIDLAGAPRIKVGGKEWAIPLLKLRQVKKITPLIGALAGMDARQVTAEQMDAAMQIVHAGLTRAYPAFPAEALEDMLAFDELLAAIPVIIGQTRAFVPKGVAEGTGQGAGEASAAGPSTGTGSSPTS